MGQVHGLPLPEVGIKRDVLSELALKPINDAPGGLALATDIAGAADEEAEGFHCGSVVTIKYRKRVKAASTDLSGRTLVFQLQSGTAGERVVVGTGKDIAISPRLIRPIP
jgi:hypothetical protein